MDCSCICGNDRDEKLDIAAAQNTIKKMDETITYEDYDMIPNISAKTILQHLPYQKFKKPFGYFLYPHIVRI